ncbi:MAG: hypothetical protein OEW68_11155 [Gammaproteobacteria bacterium]|nr:hypothetical protein [Gammaproteobacteria bacterium]MDH4315389.1 hypothetical protein [Gammaproteobacteria bacterium]MDH5214094.1 hypothetical protein [Gammaproteobacteria bacterium]MDH5501350.1 hypothetical protein [Gammaproteobacteria bacterium]
MDSSVRGWNFAKARACNRFQDSKAITVLFEDIAKFIAKVLLEAVQRPQANNMPYGIESPALASGKSATAFDVAATADSALEKPATFPERRRNGNAR